MEFLRDLQRSRVVQPNDAVYRAKKGISIGFTVLLALMAAYNPERIVASVLPFGKPQVR